MLLILLLVAIVVPWQVAFLGCWVIHLVTCAKYIAPASANMATPPRSPSPARKPAIRYLPQARNLPAYLPASPHDVEHVLLLLTWLLPLAAPVLVVWVRTLATAGPTALGNIGTGDHSFLSVAPYLILVDYASRTNSALLPRDR
jgi:GPI inositol-deacylase